MVSTAHSLSADILYFDDQFPVMLLCHFVPCDELSKIFVLGSG